MKFVHAADVHLDSPLRGLSRYDGAPVDELRGATRRALQKLVDLTIQKQADFLLIAGDIYDGDWKDHNTGLFFVSQMSRLREAGIPVVMISGNHDAANKMTKALRLPDNVTMLSHKRPDTARAGRFDELGVAIHGKSFATEAERDNLASQYPPKISGLFNIGLLHTSLTGYEGHARYAPCDLDDLRHKEYSYWALGHVHTRAVLLNDPFVVFPGNIQGRHIREPDAKGCYVVNVDSSSVCKLEFQPLDVLRWQSLSVSVNHADHIDDILDRCKEELAGLSVSIPDMPLAVRLTLTGHTEAHRRLVADRESLTNQIRAVAISATNGQAWIENVRLETSPARSDGDNLDDDGPLAELLRYVDELQQNPQSLGQVTGDLAEFQKKLPSEILRGPDGVLIDDPIYLAAMMNDVKMLLIQRLTEERTA